MVSGKAISPNWCPPFLRPVYARLSASSLGGRFARSAFWSLVGAVIARGLQLLASIIIARYLGKVHFGEYGILMNTVHMFGVFAGMGLGLTANKHIAEFRDTDPTRAGRIIGLSNGMAVLSGLVITLAVWLGAPWLAAETLAAPHLTGILRIGSLTLFLGALNGAQLGALAGFEAFRGIAKINLWSGLVAFPLTVAGVLLGQLEGAVWALVASQLCTVVMSQWELQRIAREAQVPISLRGGLQELPLLWRFSVPATLSAMMVGPITWVCNTMLVNQPDGYAQMGLYNAGFQWRTAILFVPSALSATVLPSLANLRASGDRQSVQRVLGLSLLINGAIALAVAVPVACFAPYIMLAYGESFHAGWLVLVVLSLSAVFMSLTTVAGNAIASQGKMWTGFAFNLLWAISMLVCSFIFIPRTDGALGLAGAWVVSYLIHCLLQMVYLMKTMR